MEQEEEFALLSQNIRKAVYVANQILEFAKKTLILHLRFLENALCRFQFVPAKGTVTTDGEYIYYNPYYIIEVYRKRPQLVTHLYLHMVLHCVFQHFSCGKVEPEKWNLACDIAVEAMIAELGLKCTDYQRTMMQQSFLLWLNGQLHSLTATQLYAYLRKTERSSEEQRQLKEVFTFDSHEAWYVTPDALEVRLIRTPSMSDAPSAPAEGEAHPETKNKKNADSSEPVQQYGEQSDKKGRGKGQGSGTPDESTPLPHTPGTTLSHSWKNIAEHMQMDLETFHRQHGMMAGNLVQNLHEITRDRCDYRAFLQRFAVQSEVMRVNEEEFDYNYYSYGMALYGNMPLVEPLEYKDARQIRDFVIAIDTSGSVAGTIVQEFVRKTCNILKSTESFASRVNLHILQCDTKLQKIECLRTADDFQRFFDAVPEMEIRGGGGTDFRPVFSYVEQMREEQEFTDLRGMILFTDGYGDFPEAIPPYETAVVSVGQDGCRELPGWVIRIVLTEEEIHEIEQ